MKEYGDAKNERKDAKRHLILHGCEVFNVAGSLVEVYDEAEIEDGGTCEERWLLKLVYFKSKENACEEPKDLFVRWWWENLCLLRCAIGFVHLEQPWGVALVEDFVEGSC